MMELYQNLINSRDLNDNKWIYTIDTYSTYSMTYLFTRLSLLPVGILFVNVCIALPACKNPLRTFLLAFCLAFHCTTVLRKFCAVFKMALAFHGREIGVKNTGQTANVPNDPRARLMYYLSCVSAVSIVPGLIYVYIV